MREIGMFVPLLTLAADCPLGVHWPCQPDRLHIQTFQHREIWRVLITTSDVGMCNTGEGVGGEVSLGQPHLDTGKPQSVSDSLGMNFWQGRSLSLDSHEICSWTTKSQWRAALRFQAFAPQDRRRGL